ncbi:MAG: hypothetical protein HWE26_14615 [Alteromonadaceae bacterium]|nr:hypothetical protein [Alteromonadaceae bacterium]
MYKRNGNLSEDEGQLSINDLPTELTDAFDYLINSQKKTLEGIIVQAYSRCQAIFEKRLDEHLTEKIKVYGCLKKLKFVQMSQLKSLRTNCALCKLKPKIWLTRTLN